MLKFSYFGTFENLWGDINQLCLNNTFWHKSWSHSFSWITLLLFFSCKEMEHRDETICHFFFHAQHTFMLESLGTFLLLQCSFLFASRFTPSFWQPAKSSKTWEMTKSNFNEIRIPNFFLETSLLFHWKYETTFKIVGNR